MKYNNVDTGLFLVRLGLAGVFITHGIMKLANNEATMGFFTSLGLPGWLGVVVGLVELAGGLAMLTGLYTKYAGYALAIVMVGAIFTVKGAMGFVGGWEFDIMLLLSALAITMTGPGSCVLKLK